MNTVYPYSQRLTLYSGGEIRYSCKPIVETKAKDRADRKLTTLANSDGTTPECPDSCYLTLQPTAAQRSAAEGALVNNTKFHQKEGQNGYGKISSAWKNFTIGAKRSIRRCASAAEEEFGKENCVFLTGTLPGSTPEAMATIAAWSSYLMDRLNKWLRYHCSIDDELFHLGVWELQRRGALHYHALVACANADWLIANFKTFWIELLEQLSDYTGVDLFARHYGGSWRGASPSAFRVDAQRVFASCSQYLAKYLGKTAGSSPWAKSCPVYYPDNRCLPVPCPARWWSCTRALKDLEQSKIEVFDLPPCTSDEAFQHLELVVPQLLEEMGFQAPINNPYTGYQVGIVAFGLPEIASKAAAQIIALLAESGYENQQRVELDSMSRWALITENLRTRYEEDALDSALDSAEFHSSSSSLLEVRRSVLLERLRQSFGIH